MMDNECYEEEYLLDQELSSDEDDHHGGDPKMNGKKGAVKFCDDAKFVSAHGKILLEKSQAPPVKLKKKEAAKEMCVQLLIQHGIDMTHEQVMKKINNMKARIKAKTDRHQTGNRKIILKESEKKFFELMGGVDNPSVAKRSSVQEAVHDVTEDGNESEEFSDIEIHNTPTSQIARQKVSKQGVSQKMVLEEQLKLIKAQQSYTAQLQAQQDERHHKEMEILALKKQLTLLKLKEIQGEN
ncbi:uncharacterized protein LOC134210275 [Armigeres subalbatus]|uniref:uncharacterized protein LOC134210275 n=1 Tax=Armigeres subalbatus TaxID=124917 RepID=UPI002ED0727D